jgi:hypothetical protein
LKSKFLRSILIALFGVLCVYVVGEVIQAKRASQPPAVPDIAQIRGMADANDPQLATILVESTIYIAAGYFIMGRDFGQRDERPEHLVYLDALRLIALKLPISNSSGFWRRPNEPRHPIGVRTIIRWDNPITLWLA